MNSNYQIGLATDFSPQSVKRLKKIVINAGEVSEKTFNGLLAKNPILIFYPHTDNIEGVGALKIPNDSYKNSVFKKSKTDYLPTEFKYELGWVVAIKQDKGIGQMITKILANYKPGVYATVRAKNYKMIHILKAVGFKPTGQLYNSNRGDYKIQLFIASQNTN